MKRWIVAILLLIVIATGLLYVLIPNSLHIKETIAIPVNARGFSRVILDDKKWSQWWPGQTSTNSNGAATFTFNNHSYRIIGKKLSSLVLSVANEKDSAVTELFFLPLNADTMIVNWQAEQPSPSMPLSRLQAYNKAKDLKADLSTILEKMKAFYSNEANVYGLAIQKMAVKDSALISTSVSTKGYPSVAMIYSMIGQLQAFAEKNSAKQTAPPMLNVTTADSIDYVTRVAIPVDKRLHNEGAIQYRWMMGGGNILAADVKGGPGTINGAFAEIQNYIIDSRRTAPAIPFQSLLTDRSKEPDSSKWITKLYWPVM